VGVGDLSVKMGEILLKGEQLDYFKKLKVAREESKRAVVKMYDNLKPDSIEKK